MIYGLVTTFLFGKKIKYISGAGSEKVLADGIFLPKRKIYQQTVDHINRTLKLFELHQYLLFLLRNSQNTIFVKLILKIAFPGSICLVGM